MEKAGKAKPLNNSKLQKEREEKNENLDEDEIREEGSDWLVEKIRIKYLGY